MENSQNISGSGTNYNSAIIRHELIGQVIAEKYEVKRLLGKGGMGAVYEGKHLLLEKPVAIKVMSTELAEDQSALSRFMREAKTAAKLEHPNAVTIHDFGVWQENIAYIVMEYISGISLRDLLSKEKSIPPAETVKLMSQICSAVSVAHSCGIIHRDLKPENIMLKAVGNNEPFVKVVDFGLAKIIKDEEGGGANITKTGEVFGTPYYMGPECYDGDVIDHQVDIYALGIITYEMLTGRPPFSGTIEKIIAAHLFQEPRSLAETNPILQPFDAVISLALKKKRHERLSSASEYSSLLKNILNENPSLLPIGSNISVSSQILSTNPQEINPTMKQLSGVATLIPNTAKISESIPEAHQPLDNEATRTQGQKVATAKVAATAQISANTIASYQLSNEKTQNVIPISPTIVTQAPAKTPNKTPFIAAATIGSMLILGGAFYSLSNKTSSTIPNSISPTPIVSPVNNAPTPTVKFSESENTTNSDTVGATSSPTEEVNKTEKSNNPKPANKSKTPPKPVSQQEGKNTAKTDQDDRNVVEKTTGSVVKGVIETGRFFGFGKKNERKEKREEKWEEKRQRKEEKREERRERKEERRNRRD